MSLLICVINILRCNKMSKEFIEENMKTDFPSCVSNEVIMSKIRDKMNYYRKRYKLKNDDYVDILTLTIDQMTSYLTGYESVIFCDRLRDRFFKNHISERWRLCFLTIPSGIKTINDLKYYFREDNIFVLYENGAKFW